MIDPETSDLMSIYIWYVHRWDIYRETMLILIYIYILIKILHKYKGVTVFNL